MSPRELQNLKRKSKNLLLQSYKYGQSRNPIQNMSAFEKISIITSSVYIEERRKIRNLINRSLIEARRLVNRQVNRPRITLTHQLGIVLFILVGYYNILLNIFKFPNSNFTCYKQIQNNLPFSNACGVEEVSKNIKQQILNFNIQHRLRINSAIKLLLWGMLIVLSKISVSEVKEIYHIFRKYRLKVSHTKLVQMANLMNIHLPEGHRNLFLNF
jgi:hypothetical protein